jgi:hypothetical protein
MTHGYPVVEGHPVLWLRALLAGLHNAKSPVLRFGAVLPLEWPFVAEEAALPQILLCAGL